MMIASVCDTGLINFTLDVGVTQADQFKWMVDSVRRTLFEIIFRCVGIARIMYIDPLVIRLLDSIPNSPERERERERESTQGEKTKPDKV